MYQEFDPRKSKSSRPLEPLPSSQNARKLDGDLAPDILRELEISRPSSLENPQNFEIERPKFQLRHAASHFRLRSAERALLRTENDIASLERALRRPDLINRLQPTRLHEVVPALFAVAVPTIKSAVLGFVPIALTNAMFEAPFFRALGVLAGVSVWITGPVSSFFQLKREKDRLSSGLRPNHRMRGFLLNLQDEDPTSGMRSNMIVAKLETLQQRSFKMVRAREQIEQKLLWRDLESEAN